ncbi:MAG: glycosyltransferase [Candidatus Omnitrophota bacterium]
MKIALIYNKESESTTGAYLEKVLKNSAVPYAHFWTKDAAKIPDNFDLYFRIDHGDYKYDIPNNLHPAVFYAIDTHLKKPYKKIKRQVKHYDIVFCAQKEGAEKLRRQAGVDAQWIPLACDPQINRKIDVGVRYDIGFVGRDAKKFARGRHLELLKEKYPRSFIGSMDFRNMAKVYSAAKIGFNSSIINDINMRIFEVMACGCFLLTNRIRDNGFDSLFQDGKHLVTYRNDRELIELIDYYLANEKEREAIAQAGFDLVVNNHTYYHRVQSIFNYIAFRLGGQFNQLRI